MLYTSLMASQHSPCGHSLGKSLEPFASLGAHYLRDIFGDVPPSQRFAIKTPRVVARILCFIRPKHKMGCMEAPCYR